MFAAAHSQLCDQRTLLVSCSYRRLRTLSAKPSPLPASCGRAVTLAITGQRGGEDDCLRGTRAWKDGAIAFNKAAGIWTANPLDGWTATMINRYTAAHALPHHPARDAGAVTIGCIWCGGGSQYSASCYRILRTTAPDLWRRFVVDLRGGEIILAVKYRASLRNVRQALERMGGLAFVADSTPWVFDFTEMPPRRNYDR